MADFTAVGGIEYLAGSIEQPYGSDGFLGFYVSQDVADIISPAGAHGAGNTASYRFRQHQGVMLRDAVDHLLLELKIYDRGPGNDGHNNNCYQTENFYFK
ncbi:MAG TPA: hypothetical protein VI298_18330 [Geobacteraceae bacterium]